MRRDKSLLLAALILAGFPLVHALTASAEETCAKHLKSTCSSCHPNQRACERLGNPAKAWKGILSLMMANGAELSKEEMEAMTLCLSEPSPAAKAVCQK